MTERTRPLVIGHRGASGYRPEHTRSAYELAFHLGAEGLELAEVDGELVSGLAEVGHHGAEQDRAPDRGEGVLGPHQQGGRRTEAHALESAQNLGEDAAP